MPITLNAIPAGIRTPFVFVEFDSSKAQTGPRIKNHKLLVIGQKLSAGTVAQLIPTRFTRADDVATAFGKGSMLHGMAIALFANNRFTEAWFVAQDDAGAGTQGTKTITVTAAATAAGSIVLYVAGRRIPVAVASGDSTATIAASINTAVTAVVDTLPATSGVAGSVVTLTAKHKGEEGNRIDVRVNYFPDEFLPAGVALTIATGVSGVTNPTISAVWTVLGEEQYDEIAIGYSDASNYALIDTELESRWGPLRMIDGRAFLARQDTLSNLTTYGSAKNSKHVSVMGYKSAPTPPWEWASAYAAQAALAFQADPARPLTSLVLEGVLPPAALDRFTLTEDNVLLNNGIATQRTSVGKSTIGRAISGYRVNLLGAADTAFLDFTTHATLGFLRWDFRNRMLTKYPRHKLAKDGTSFGLGQSVVTPASMRGEVVAIFRTWESMGLVEGFDQFKRDLLIEINPTDPNRLDIMLPTDLINQLLVTGAQFAFLL